MDIKPLPEKSLEHYCDLHPQAIANPNAPLDVRHINPSCIRAMYTRGLIEYEFSTVNNQTSKRILFTKLGLKYGCESLALVPNDSREKRKREVLKLYLDMDKPDHAEAWSVARSLASERILTPTVVDFFIMHAEFLNGNTDTLAEAYPGVYKLLTESRHENLLDKLEALVNQQAPQAHENAPALRPVGLQAMNTQASAGIKGIGLAGNTPQFAAPTFDDDEDDTMPVLTIKRDTSTNANANFLKAMAGLQGK